MVRSLLLLAAFSALAAAPTVLAEEAPDGGATPSGRERLEVQPIAGTVTGIDRQQRRVTLETASGPVVLGYDRDTTVFLPHRVGTVLDLTPGTRVSAAADPEKRAYWFQVRKKPGQAEPAADGGAQPEPGGTPRAPDGQPAEQRSPNWSPMRF